MERNLCKVQLYDGYYACFEHMLYVRPSRKLLVWDVFDKPVGRGSRQGINQCQEHIGSATPVESCCCCIGQPVCTRGIVMPYL